MYRRKGGIGTNQKPCLQRLEKQDLKAEGRDSLARSVWRKLTEAKRSVGKVKPSSGTLKRKRGKSYIGAKDGALQSHIRGKGRVRAKDRDRGGRKSCGRGSSDGGGGLSHRSRS